MHVRPLTIELAPWTLFRALARRPRPFFIDAGLSWGAEWVSCMGFAPRMQLRVAAGDGCASPLDELETLLGSCKPSARDLARPRAVPFAGGAVVGLAYELKNTIERHAVREPLDSAAPLLAAAVYDAVVAYDHRARRYVAASWHLDAAGLARYADEVLDAANEARALVAPSLAHAGNGTPSRGAIRNLDDLTYSAAVHRVREYIAAGDIYQANVSMRFRAAYAASPLALYERLRDAQPVPFGGYFDLGTERVLSNSPELFLRRRGGRLETCPIKGTRPRGDTEPADRRLGDELRAHPKERAEHVMIVDLERSDLGRVCRTGSVRVTRFAELARFRTLQHLVSTVQGTIDTALTTRDLLAATFPGGSITGAPKIRAMEIIEEVERAPRGFYTGSLGWIDASGDCDLNIAIRTAVVADGSVTYHAGSGIVADSEPALEHAECVLKSQAFFHAMAPDRADLATAPDAGVGDVAASPPIA